MYAFLFICSMLVPLSMVILGNKYKKSPPRDRNGMSGYRSTMSRINQDTWEFAHKYFGKILLISGIALVIISLVIMSAIKDRSDFETIVVYLVFMQIGVMALIIIPTEIKLNKVFDKQGKRK